MHTSCPFVEDYYLKLVTTRQDTVTDQADRTLTALLACPPTTSGTRTINALAVACQCLELPTFRIANLLSVPARDTKAMSEAGSTEAPWNSSRPALLQAMLGASQLLAAWGVYPLLGAASNFQRMQIAWLMQAARELGHSHAWTLGGQPRHPSRWHQFTSDRHGRTGTGLSREERIAALLTRVPLAQLTPQL